MSTSKMEFFEKTVNSWKSLSIEYCLKESHCTNQSRVFIPSQVSYSIYTKKGTLIWNRTSNVRHMLYQTGPVDICVPTKVGFYAFSCVTFYLEKVLVLRI